MLVLINGEKERCRKSLTILKYLSKNKSKSLILYCVKISKHFSTAPERVNPGSITEHIFKSMS